jgi:dihydropteroate synthase
MQSKNIINKTEVWGILNCTPDSFYDGDEQSGLEQLKSKVQAMVLNQVDYIDIGGQSTRPGAKEINAHEELGRIMPILKWIKSTYPNQKISIDTFHPEVADAVLKLGVEAINDVSGASNIDLLKCVAEYGCRYVLMHNQSGKTQSSDVILNHNIMDQLLHFFQLKMEALQNMGIHPIVLDPGFGFAKTLDENYQILNQLEKLVTMDAPVLVGISRKSMMYKLLNKTPQEMLAPTTALHLYALQKGVSILRVHDVQEAQDIIKIHKQLNQTKIN